MWHKLDADDGVPILVQDGWYRCFARAWFGRDHPGQRKIDESFPREIECPGVPAARSLDQRMGANDTLAGWGTRHRLILDRATLAEFCCSEKSSDVVRLYPMLWERQALNCQGFVRTSILQPRQREIVQSPDFKKRDEVVGTHVTTGTQSPRDSGAGPPIRWRSSRKVAISPYIYFSLHVGYAKFQGMVSESQEAEPSQAPVDVPEACLLGCPTPSFR